MSETRTLTAADLAVLDAHARYEQAGRLFDLCRQNVKDAAGLDAAYLAELRAAEALSEGIWNRAEQSLFAALVEAT